MQTLKVGSKGELVKELQTKLKITVDGVFGKDTQKAVREYQQEHNLTPDGIVGNATWSKLNGGITVNTSKINRRIDSIILHCSATPEGRDFTVHDITTWHKQRGFSTIGYHYVIYRDGSVHAGRSLETPGAHCEGHNSHSIGICYIGGLSSNGSTPKDTRTTEQKKALIELVKNLMKDFKIDEEHIYCHNQFANKACPSFKIETFKQELNA